MAGIPALAQLFTFLSFGRYNSVPPILADGSVGETQLDQMGRLLVATTPAQTTKTVTSLMNSSGSVLKAASGKLWAMQGASGGTSGTTKYLQLFDLNVGLTSGTTVPLVSIPVGGQLNFSDTFGSEMGLSGLPFANGIQWAVSSTQFVYTADTTKLSLLAVFE